MSKWALGSTHPALQGARGHFLGYSGRDMKWTTHLHLVLTLSSGVAVFLLPPTSFRGVERDSLTFTFLHFNIFIHEAVDLLDTAVYFRTVTYIFWFILLTGTN